MLYYVIKFNIIINSNRFELQGQFEYLKVFRQFLKKYLFNFF